MVLMDSCLAGSMKAQVLTMMTSASSGRGVSSYPWCARIPSITSLSTRFLGQPRLTIPTFLGIRYKLRAFSCIAWSLEILTQEAGHGIRDKGNGAGDTSIAIRGWRPNFNSQVFRFPNSTNSRPGFSIARIPNSSLLLFPCPESRVPCPESRLTPALPLPRENLLFRGGGDESAIRREGYVQQRLLTFLKVLQ